MTPWIMSTPASPDTNAPRRLVVAGEDNKIDGFITPDDKVSGGKGKDLKHYFRARKGLDSVKKKLMLDFSPYPRRTRLTVTPKPRCKTGFSLFTKNFLFFLVLSHLVQLESVSVIGTGSDGSVNLAGSSDMEGQNVESFLKKTTAMLQLQLEAVRKLDGAFSGLRGELNKKFEEKSEEIVSRLKVLDEKNEILEKMLGQLTSKDFLSKEDFSRLYEEIKKSRDGDLGQSELSLDEVKGLARQIVVNEIERQAADGLGMVDYANMSACLIPEAITLEHVAQGVAYDHTSAPKDCSVLGRLQGDQAAHGLVTESSVDCEKMLHLTPT